jgi:hypothetical protein
MRPEDIPSIVPPPPQPALEPDSEISTPQTFEATWSPSKVAALDPDTLTLSKRLPRGWDRVQHAPSTEQSRFKAVWKRYELRAQPAPTKAAPSLEPTTDAEETIDIRPASPERVVKRLRVAGPRQSRPSIASAANEKKASGYIETKWERRRSVLTRMNCQRVLDLPVSNTMNRENTNPTRLRPCADRFG